ncbi:MAG: hypothetical protein ACW964_01700 [Candidatus Hodarchaeales archaeon]|jgi:ribosomal protein S25
MSVTDKKTRKKRRWGRVFEYSSYERQLPVGDQYTEILDELSAEYSKRKTIVVTPQEIASKRDIRVSVAKRLLAELAEKNIVKRSYSNRRIQIYVKA